MANTLELLNNTGQMRNIWLKSPDERLEYWREFRLALQDQYDPSSQESLLQSLNAIGIWWSYAPIVSITLDPYSLSKWPTIWEIIAEGHCCKYSRGLAIAYNIHYLDPALNVSVDRVFDDQHHDEYFVANVAGLFLNTPYENVIPVQNATHLTPHESWPIHEVLHQKEF